MFLFVISLTFEASFTFFFVCKWHSGRYLIDFRNWKCYILLSVWGQKVPQLYRSVTGNEVIDDERVTCDAFTAFGVIILPVVWLFSLLSLCDVMRSCIAPCFSWVVDVIGCVLLTLPPCCTWIWWWVRSDIEFWSSWLWWWLLLWL